MRILYTGVQRDPTSKVFWYTNESIDYYLNKSPYDCSSKSAFLTARNRKTKTNSDFRQCGGRVLNSPYLDLEKRHLDLQTAKKTKKAHRQGLRYLNGTCGAR